MPRYGERTDVTPARSRAELERIVARYGVAEYGVVTAPTHAVVAFAFEERRVRIRLDLPERTPRITAAQYEQALRQRWRALVLVVKAKLEAVESGIETVDQAFLPYIVLPDGSTVGEQVAPAMRAALASGTVPALISERSLTP